MESFSAQDAGDLVMVARRAPLSNMDEAKAVNELLERFVKFFEWYQSSISNDDAESGSED